MTTINPSPFYRSLPLAIKKLSPAATLPIRGSEYAAGVDLSAAHAVVIPAGGRAIVKTDLALAVPPGTYGRIAPRSGLAVRNGIDVLAGVIDADYRGNVGVVFVNFGTESFSIQTGDRIAQLILEQILVPTVQECVTLPELGERGEAGYGSTGVPKSSSEETEDKESSAKKQRTITPSNSEDDATEKDQDMKEA